jgi:outer membrane protein TolC
VKPACEARLAKSRHRFPFRLALLMAIAGAPQFAIAQGTSGDALSLNEALKVAASRSGQLVAQDAAAAAAREMALAAGRLPDPVVRAGINNLPVSGADAGSLTRDFMTMRSIGVSQEFTRADKRRAREARYERESDAAAASKAVLLSTLQRATAMAWFGRYYRERMLELLRAQRAELGLQVEAAQAALRGNRGSQADVYAARTALLLLDDRIRQAESQVTSAQLMLARWIGDMSARPLDAAPALATTRLAPEHLESQIAHHPELLLMARQEEIARAEVNIAQAAKRSDWSVELMYSQRGPAYSNMVSLNVSIPLQWDQKNRQERELSARLAQAEQSRAQREEATREHLAETRRWLQEWQANLRRLAHYDTDLIPLAIDRTSAALAAYRGASASLVSLLEARRAEIDTRIERLRLEQEVAALWVQLEYLVPFESGRIAMHAEEIK